MVKAVTTSRFDYVIEEERELPLAEQTIFKLRYLTARERAQIQSQTASVSGAGDVNVDAGEFVLLAVRAGLEGWENLVDDDGNPVEFKKESKPQSVLGKLVVPPKDEMLDLLPPSVLAELAGAIQQGATLTVEQAGN